MVLLLYQTEEAASIAGWREILGGGGLCRYLIGANKRSKVRFLKHNVEADFYYHPRIRFGIL